MRSSAVAIVPVTGDRGLAGAFNAQVLRRAFVLQREAQAAGQEVVWFSAGKKAASSLRFRRLEIGQAWTGFSDRPAYADAQNMAHELAEAYTSEQVDRVVIVYNAFVSPLVQKVTVREILPIPTEMLQADSDDDETKRLAAISSTSRSPRRSSPGCFRCTSKRRSTGRCSSRQPRSRALG